MRQYIFFLFALAMLTACRENPEVSVRIEDIPPINKGTQYVVGIGKIIPENDIIQVSSHVSGLVQKILKNENEIVAPNTIILELNHSLEDAKILSLEQTLKTQNSLIQMEMAGVRETRALFNKSKAEWQRLNNLLNKGAETKQNAENAAAEAESLQGKMDRLEASVAVAKNRLLETKAALRTAQIEKEQKIIRSPVEGRILECDIKPGESVVALQPFLQIKPEGKTIAFCEIDESTADKVRVGQKGWIRKVGTTDTLSTGSVFFTYSFLNKKSLFTDQAGEREDRRVRRIKMMLDRPEALLLNARVECVIDISEPGKQ
jgi:HlyD family secretion protein